MSAKRYVIEGTWSGYTSAQQRVAQRKVYPASSKKLRAWAERAYGIRFGDGTSLFLSVRDCALRERVKEVNGYGKLINDCCHYNVASVDELVALEKGRDALNAATGSQS